MLIRNPDPSDVSDDDWAFVAPYLTRMTARPHSVSIAYVRASMAYVGSCVPVPQGGGGHTICRPGQRSTSKLSGG